MLHQVILSEHLWDYSGVASDCFILLIAYCQRNGDQ